MLELTEGFLRDWLVRPPPGMEIAEKETAEERLLKWLPPGRGCFTAPVKDLFVVVLLGLFLTTCFFFYRMLVAIGVVVPESYFVPLIGDLKESGLIVCGTCMNLLC